MKLLSWILKLKEIQHIYKHIFKVMILKKKVSHWFKNWLLPLKTGPKLKPSNGGYYSEIL